MFIRVAVTACLLKNEPASYAVCGEVNPCGVAVAKASPNRAFESHALDPKRSDLAMGRLKRG